jgi:transposase-like protein
VNDLDCPRCGLSHFKRNSHTYYGKQNYQCKECGRIERFNCTLRQRVSRLVRCSLSFSKTMRNHIGAIKYFICHYNREVIELGDPALHF